MLSRRLPNTPLQPASGTPAVHRRWGRERVEQFVALNPRLVRERLNAPGDWLRDKVGNDLDGFFQRPYLLWFVAEDPVRNGQLPGNIADVTRAIIRAAAREAVETLREQVDYAPRLEANVEADRRPKPDSRERHSSLRHE